MSAFTEYKFAWEPITPRGVAAFSRASFERLFVVQSIFALFAVIAVVWLLGKGFFPAVAEAVTQLPDSGLIAHGALDIADDQPRLLAESHFLAFVIDGKHSGQIRSPAQFQFEFGDNSLWIYSLFGVAEIDYPASVTIFGQNYQSFYFNRTDLQPKWGAWAPEILGLAALAVFFSLLLSWALLATVYFLPVWLICFFSNHDLNFRASWRLAGAALMPGALLMAIAIWLYGLGVFDVVKLCFAFGMHFLLGWIYLFVSPFFLQRTSPAEAKNPFGEKK